MPHSLFYHYSATEPLSPVAACHHASVDTNSAPSSLSPVRRGRERLHQWLNSWLNGSLSGLLRQSQSISPLWRCRLLCQALLFAMFSGCFLTPAQAAILSNSSEQSINRASSSYRSQVNSRDEIAEQLLGGDNMGGLIQRKQQEFAGTRQAQVNVREQQRIRLPGQVSSTGINVSSMDFNVWLNASSYRREQVGRYQRYLADQLGNHNVPPMSQLLTTARSWDDCGFNAYQIPPEYLWSNIVPTIRLYNLLKGQGVLPRSSEIRSVYRSPDLNRCAGGASGSKHMTNGAMDIWVPEFDGNLGRIASLQDSLCEFWLSQGRAHNFGLGIYGTGSIHLDTQGYRKWGASNTSSFSPCRY